MTGRNWWGPGQTWLQEKANEHYAAWRETKEGKKYKHKPGTSPHQFGYRQPDWMHEAVDALGKGDEERFKAIKLANL